MMGWFKATVKHPDNCVCHLDWDSHTKAFKYMTVHELKKSHFLALGKNATYVIGKNDDTACRGHDVLDFTKLYADGEVVVPPGSSSSSSSCTTMVVSSPRAVVSAALRPPPPPLKTLALSPYLPEKTFTTTTITPPPPPPPPPPPSAPPQVIVIPRSNAGCMDVFFLLLQLLRILTYCIFAACVFYLVMQTLYCGETMRADTSVRERQLAIDRVTYKRDCVNPAYLTDTSDCEYKEVLIKSETMMLKKGKSTQTRWEICYVNPIRYPVLRPLADWTMGFYTTLNNTTWFLSGVSLLKSVLSVFGGSVLKACGVVA